MALWPLLKRDDQHKTFLSSSAGENIDFYGPWWISTTLAFTLGAVSNAARYFELVMMQQLNSSGGMLQDDLQQEEQQAQSYAQSWHYDFHLLTAASSLCYTYAFLCPLLLWLYCKYSRVNVRLAQLICVYGYSVTSFIPAIVVRRK